MENNGEPIILNFNKLSNKEKATYAKQFAEGSVYLEELLLNLWNNNIQTTSCCAGHLNKSNAYISFNVNNFEEQNLNRVLTNIMYFYNKGEIDVGFALSSIHEDKDSKIISLYAKEGGKHFFELVSIILLQNEEYKISQKDKGFINEIKALFSLSLEKYFLKSKRVPIKQYGYVDLSSQNDKWLIRTINNAKYKFTKIKNKQGKPIRHKLLEGYYIKAKDGNFYTVIKGEVVQIKTNLQKYKQLRTYKKYCSVVDYSSQAINSIIQEIKF